MSLYNRNNLRTDKEETKKRSSIQMKQNILNYFSSFNARSKVKKIASLNDKKTEIINNYKREEFLLDFEKKSKAKRSLLYLLNIRSKGTFCPQIIDYFKNIKHSNKKEELLKQRNESKENNINENNNFVINNNNDINSSKIPKRLSKFYAYKTAKNNISNEKNEINEIKANFNDNNILNNENNELNFDIKSIDNINDNRELTEMNNENVKLEKNDRIETIPGNRILFKEIGTNNTKNIKKSIIKNKSRKKSYKKNIKKDRIDTIYNEQRNELQKFGNYHQSLRTAIQSSLAKKNLVRKKK